MSAPTGSTIKVSLRVVKLRAGPLRAASNPIIPTAARKTKKGKEGSKIATASDERSTRRKANTSQESKAIRPKDDINSENSDSYTDSDAPVARRKKWSGKPIAILILEALRAAKSTKYTLRIAQVKDYIEKYRLTTDMEHPAHSQTIRTNLLKNCHPKNPKGLWEHLVPPGERTGPYRLLPAGFAADAVVPEDDGEEGA
jgi:hypothetical protein